MEQQKPLNTTAVLPSPDEDIELVTAIGRGMYLHFCKIRSFTPQPPPFVPSWCYDYARIALRVLEDEGFAIQWNGEPHA